MLLVRLIEWVRSKRRKPVPVRKGYGYEITDSMFNRKWTGKYNDIA